MDVRRGLHWFEVAAFLLLMVVVALAMLPAGWLEPAWAALTAAVQCGNAQSSANVITR